MIDLYVEFDFELVDIFWVLCVEYFFINNFKLGRGLRFSGWVGS